MGDVFRGDTSLEESVADGEIGFVGIHKPKLPAFSFGKSDVYSPFLQIGYKSRRGQLTNT